MQKELVNVLMLSTFDEAGVCPGFRAESHEPRALEDPIQLLEAVSRGLRHHEEHVD